MERGDQQRITVVTETRNLRTQPFIPPENQLYTGKQWEEWLEGIEREFRYFKITEALDKKDALVIYGGKEIARLERSLANEVGDDEYCVLKNKLNKYFKPKRNKHHARYTFLKMEQWKGETIGAYITRLREKANDCDFGETTDERILEHCIQSISNRELIRKTISKGWIFERFIEEAAQMDDIDVQMQEMSIYRVQKNSHNVSCSYCGLNHNEGTKCPAYGKICRNCGKRNHFASVCKATIAQDHEYNNGTHTMRNRREVKKTVRYQNSDTDSSPNDYSEEDEYFSQDSIKHIAKIGKVRVVSKKMIFRRPLKSVLVML